MQDLISQFEMNPTLGLQLIIENNAAAVRAQLQQQGIAVSNNKSDIYSKVASLLNTGQKEAALLALSVPIVADNLPDGYMEEFQTAGLINSEYDTSSAPPPLDENGNPSASGDNTGGTDGTGGSKNTLKWGDFFDFASQVIVGLWGTPKYGQNPYGPPPPKQNNTTLYIVIAVLIMIVLAGFFISVKRK